MFPLKFSLALILGFVKFDKCADLVVPAQPTYVPRLKVLFPALPPLFLFHGDLKFSKSSVSALQDKWFLILPVNPFSATVLFDTGASHSFISQSFAHA